MLEKVCGSNETKWLETQEIGKESIQITVDFYDGIYNKIKNA